MTNEFDYYLIDRNNWEAYPLIEITNFDELDYTTFMYIQFASPIPRNPVLADFLLGLYLPSFGYYFSRRIANAIEKMNIYGIRFISTELTDPKGNVSNDYFCLDVTNRIAAMNQEKSEYKFKDYIHDDSVNREYSIDKFVLDKVALKQTPLEKRLVFLLEEAGEEIVLHKSVVDAIIAEKPTGIQFHHLEGSSLLKYL